MTAGALPAATLQRASSHLVPSSLHTVLSLLTGCVLLTVATLVHHPTLIAADSIPAALRFLIVEPPLQSRYTGPYWHPSLLPLAVLLAIALLLLAPALRDLGRTLARLPRTLRPQRTRVAAMAIPLAVFSLAFLPVGGRRLLTYYCLAIPGFLLLLLPAWPALSRLVGRFGPGVAARLDRMSPGRFSLLVFLLTFALTNALSLLVFEHTPHVITGIAHVFHARILADGHLFLPSHALNEFFDLHTLVNYDGRWFAHFPPAHTALVAVGVLFGKEWMVNPLLGSLSVVALYHLGREIYGDRVGKLAGLLGVLSPALLLMSAEFYNHATSLLFVTLFVLFFAKMVRTHRPRFGLAAGLCLAVVLNARPLTAVAASFPFLIYGLWLATRLSPRYRLAYLLQAAAVAVGAATLLCFNYGTTGHFLTFGYNVSISQHYSEAAAGLTLWGGIVNTINRLRLFDAGLFGWPIPGTLFALALFLAGTRNVWDYLLIGSFFCGVIAYAFWYYPGLEFGARYYHYALPILCLLTARGFFAVPRLLGRLFARDIGDRAASHGAAVALLSCFLIAFVWNSYPSIAYYQSDDWYWQIDHRLVEAVREREITHAVVFVETEIMYRSAFLHNSLDVDSSNVVYARNLGEKNQLLMAYYPNRRYYTTDGRTIAELHPQPATSRTDTKNEVPRLFGTRRR